MRGKKENQIEMFSYVMMEDRVPKSHPLRTLKVHVDSILTKLSKDFDGLYSYTGRPSIPPEQLLKALFLQTLYTIRSEGQLIEQLNYNMLYRWFVGLDMDDKVWDETVFTKNRDRLIDGDIADRFFNEILAIAEKKKLISHDHFTVDGTLIEAWASLKSFRKKDEKKQDNDDTEDGNRNISVDFHGEKRKNDTHESTTDPESKIYTKAKGVAAKLTYMGHVAMENRNGFAIDSRVTQAEFHAETNAALEMACGLSDCNRKTMGADKAYDQEFYVEGNKELNITPHVTQNFHVKRKHSHIDGRTTRHEGYEISQRKRKRVEEIFGWLKNIGLLRRPHFRGSRKINFMFTFALAVYNLVRIKNIEPSFA
jgi:transposase